jgi:hypothetical protein
MDLKHNSNIIKLLDIYFDCYFNSFFLYGLILPVGGLEVN